MVFKTGHARRVRSAVMMALSALAATAAGAHDRDRWHGGHDGVVVSSATVGDDGQDDKSQGPATLVDGGPNAGEGGPGLNETRVPQDEEYLQNRLAWTTMQQGIQAKRPNLLYFNGGI